jgi:hypothetical protein
MYLMAKHDPRRNQNPSMAAMSCPPPPQNSNDGAKDDEDNGPADGVGCSDHFVGGVGALMGSGAMMTTTTKINDGDCPPQVVVAV